MKSAILFFILFAISFISVSQTTPFKKYNPCAFAIELPIDMRMSKMYSDASADYCDFQVKMRDGYPIMELHSLLSSRFEFGTIKEAYKAALASSKLNITYKAQIGNFFVISGYNPQNGNIVYWKRVMGRSYVSDMQIEYNRSRKDLIEKNLGRIAKSFQSK
jgi:hypothetical protein